MAEQTRLSFPGLELITRQSVHSLRSPSIEFVEPLNLGRALRNFYKLREEFKNKNLNGLFQEYQHRLLYVKLKSFFILQGCTSLLFLVIMVSVTKNVETVEFISKATIQGALLLFSVILYLLTHWKEEYLEKNIFKQKLIGAAVAIVWVVLNIIPNLLNLKQAMESGIENWFSNSIYVILVIYSILPFTSIRSCIGCGVLCSALNITITQLPLRYSKTLAAEMIYFFVLNLIGIYSKVMNEVMLRRAFFDRTNCLKSTLTLEYEKEQEEKLMLSILPKYIAARVSHDIQSTYESILHTRIDKSPFKALYVESHNDVSILFADIVNFTPLTAKLSVVDLVEMLNDLFENFDSAAKENNCIRIKILGDCYYCISGISDTEQEDLKNHAENCIKMGFKMIDIIRSVREDREVDVDMRIGTHTGSIICGIIGILKWQYDIWSRDVTIANHMEQSGFPGRIHISEATKQKLGDLYKFEKGSSDSYLSENRVETFLVIPKNGNEFINAKGRSKPAKSININADFCYEIQEYDSDEYYHRAPGRLEVELAGTNGNVQNIQRFSKSISSKNSKNQTRKISWNGSSPKVSSATGDQESLKIFRKPPAGAGKRSSVIRRRSTQREVRRSAVGSDSSVIDYQKILSSTDERMSHVIRNMNLPLSRKRNKEETTLLSPLLLLFQNRKWEFSYWKQRDTLFRYYSVAVMFILVAIGAIYFFTLERRTNLFYWLFGSALFWLVFTSVIYWTSEKIDRNNSKTEMLSFLLSAVSKLSERKIVRDSFTAIILCLISALVTTEMQDTMATVLNNNGNEVYSVDNQLLWNMTYCCTLAIIAGFVYIRINFLVKILCYFAVASVYAIQFVFNLNSYCELQGKRTCDGAMALDHIQYLFNLCCVLHLIDRMVEFVQRMNYIWQRQLTDENFEAKKKREINNVLLRNILPDHVADKFVDSNRNSETVFAEEYQNTVVMFATILNYTECYADEKCGIDNLAILNNIITEFDSLLIVREEYTPIEKIKLIGSTFMAACRLQSSCKRENISLREGDKAGSNLKIMFQFAYEISQILANMENVDEQFKQLRIGIDCGPVIAGVVGTQKPLYDIWGDTVNVASRMNYTGGAGKMQVTEQTANMLFKEGISSTYRGPTFVKGKGQLLTYWINAEISKKTTAINSQKRIEEKNNWFYRKMKNWK